MNNYDPTPVLVEIIDESKLSDYQRNQMKLRLGDQFVMAAYYANQNDYVKIIKTLPEGTPYGAYKDLDNGQGTLYK